MFVRPHRIAGRAPQQQHNSSSRDLPRTLRVRTSWLRSSSFRRCSLLLKMARYCLALTCTTSPPASDCCASSARAAAYWRGSVAGERARMRERGRNELDAGSAAAGEGVK